MDAPIEGFRLSPQQRRIWELQRSDGSTAYRARCVLRLTGDPDPAALAGALEDVVAEQEILRTAFRLIPGMELPLQVPCDDPEGGRALDAVLETAGAGELRLRLELPALCADAAALENLAARIAAAYAARRGEETGAEPPPQYIDLAEWQNQLFESPDTAAGADRWREDWRNAGIPARLARPLPFGEPRPAAGPFAPAVLPVPLDPGLAAALTALAAAWEAPEADLFLAAWLILLYQSTGWEDLVLGVLHDGRRHPDLRPALGPLARYLPVQVRLDGTDRPRDLLRRLRETLEEVAGRQELFSWELVADGGSRGSRGGEPLFFPVCFDGTGRSWEAAAAGARFSLAESGAVVDRFAVELAVSREDGAPRLTLRHDPLRVSAAAAARLAERLTALLRGLAERPDAAVEELHAVGEEERRLLAGWSGAGAQPADEEATLHRLFAAQAESTPGRAAVISPIESLTYAELRDRARRLAWRLRELGVEPEVPVAVCLERSAEQVVAVLAVLEAGGAYVPLDPAHPRERLDSILEDTGAPLVLTRGHLLPAGVRPECRRLLLDGEETARPRPATPPEDRTLPGNLAYVIYTSGSTGRPKGVRVEHRSPLRLLAALEEAVLSRHGRDRDHPLRASLNAPLFFDASVQQLVLLLAGHTLCVIPEEVRTDGAALLAFLDRQRVDLFDCTPSQLRILLAAGLLTAPGHVPEIVLCAGEAIDPATWEALRRSARPRFYNLYGPTEATVDATAFPVDEAAGGPTLGRPLRGWEVWLLDRRLRPVPAGAPGEVCLGGAGLARGYNRRPDVTAERFVPHPFATAPGARLYRTGDLARWLPDGGLEHIGRTDHQVKIRGYRIELGEIEAALSSHPWVREVVVEARPAPGGAAEPPLLAAYFLPSTAAPAGLPGVHGELARFLSERLPVYMVPAAFVVLPALPRTPNGKVDRRALPDPSPERPDLGVEYAPPRNLREEVLAETWARVLGLERVGIDDSFFALGGDSIRSLQVQALARERGVGFSVQDLFQHQTIRELATVLPAGEETLETVAVRRREPFDLLSAEDRGRIPGELLAEIEDAYPLTLLQAGLLFHNEMSPETGVYQDIVSFRVRTRLDVAALEAALQEVADHHPVLRTSFDLVRYTVPVQLVHRTARVPVTVKDLSGLPGELQEREIAALLEREKTTPFDWRRPPLIRVHVHALGEAGFQFTLTEHHAVLDGWSLATLLTELFKLYAAALGEEGAHPEQPPPAVFRELVALEQQALASEASRSYWLRLLGDGARSQLPRWPSVPGDGASAVTRVFELSLPEEVGIALHELARAASVPLKCVLLAAHLRVLAAVTGKADVLTGISSDGRPEVDGADRSLGLYVSMLPFRAGLAGGTWSDLARQVFAAELELLPHRRFPLGELQRLLGGGAPLFDTFFNFTHFHVYQDVEQVSGITVERQGGFEMMNLPLTANFGVDPFTQRVSLGMNVHLNVIAEEQARALLAYYERTLTAMAAAPAARYDAFSPLPEDERRQILTVLGRGAAQPDPVRPFHRLFEERAARHPERIAVEGDGRRLTYGELDRLADAVACRLRRLGAGPEARVAVALERSPRMLAALLGVMKSGAAYVPLDPEYPRERLAWMLEDSAPVVLIAERRTEGALPPCPAPLLSLDDPLEMDGERTAVPVDGEHPVYVIYTSGSTGRPKGVSIPHRALVNFLESLRREPGLGQDDVLLAVTSLSFDIAGLELYLPLLAGGRVVVASRDDAADGRRLAALLATAGATVLQATPATWRLLLEAGWRGGPGFRALVGGEAVSPPLAADLRERAGEVWNLYGPTETTIWSTVADLTRTATVTIGLPVARTLICVADGLGHPAPVAVPGELRVGGLGLARGYLNRPDLTAERFVPDPFSGEPGARLYRTGDLGRLLPEGSFDCLGRLDFQVKLRGFRVELGEVEAALEAHPGVREAVAMAQGEGEARRLVAYLAPHPEVPAPAAAELREALRERLPDYMLPAFFVVVEALPRTPNGKIDRRRLPPPDLAEAAPPRQTDEAPRNETERLLARMWAEALEVQRVGIHDNFIESGGHSLLAMRLVSRIRETFRIDLPLRVLYETGTVARLAVKVVALQAEQTDQLALERMLAELEAISDLEAQSLLAGNKESHP